MSRRTVFLLALVVAACGDRRAVVGEDAGRTPARDGGGPIDPDPTQPLYGTLECPGRSPDDVGESLFVWRDAEAAAYREGLIAARESEEGAAEVSLSYDSSGRLTYYRYDADGYAYDFSESFSYDSNGRLTYWSHDADGYANDVDESFSYDSDGRLTYWSHDADGYATDIDESFSYDSHGRITYWNHDGDGYAYDVSESFSYDADGRLTHWRRDADGYANDIDESFSYDSDGRLTYWSRDSETEQLDRSYTYDCA